MGSDQARSMPGSVWPSPSISAPAAPIAPATLASWLGGLHRGIAAPRCHSSRSLVKPACKERDQDFGVVGNHGTNKCEIATSNPVIDYGDGAIIRLADGPDKTLDDAKLARSTIQPQQLCERSNDVPRFPILTPDQTNGGERGSHHQSAILTY